MTRVRVQAVHPGGEAAEIAHFRGVDVLEDFGRLQQAAERVWWALGARGQIAEWTIRPDHYEDT